MGQQAQLLRNTLNDTFNLADCFSDPLSGPIAPLPQYDRDERTLLTKADPPITSPPFSASQSP
jgi:hypothetical protein